MKLDTFRRLDDHERRVRQLERTEPEAGGGGDHADSDHADAFSPLVHTHGPGGGSVAWSDITGKPSSFPPDEHDPSHDDRFALIVHTHAVHADSDHDDRFSLLAHVHVVAWADITGKPSTFTPAEHDSDHDDRFSLLAHVHDWASITGKPSTFTPTPQALDWLTDVATAGQASTNVLTYNGSSWVPAAIPAATWASITGKPSTFPPTPETVYLHDLVDVDTFAATDGHVLTYDSTAPAGWKPEPSNGLPAGGTPGQQLVKTSTTDYDADWETVGGGAVGIPPGGDTGQSLMKSSDTDYAVDWGFYYPTWSSVTGKPTTFPPTSHDSDHDDRFSLLAHTHAAHADSDHDDRFALIEHDTAHDDRFSLLAHTHAAHADSDHDDRFSLLAHLHTATYAAVEHDTAHDDRFSQLAHTHTGTYAPAVGAWQAMTSLTSPWIAAATAQAPRYRLEGDVVRLDGGVTRPSGSNLPIFPLPSGFRPVVVHTYAVSATNAFGRVTVGADGIIRFTHGVATGEVSLDGITFPIT